MSAATTWTEADKDVLRREYARADPFEIARMLGGRHTTAAIKTKAQLMRLKRAPKHGRAAKKQASEWEDP